MACFILWLGCAFHADSNSSSSLWASMPEKQPTCSWHVPMPETQSTRPRLKIRMSQDSYTCSTWVKASCKRMIMPKEALLRLTILSFSRQNQFKWHARGTFVMASKSPFLKHKDGSTQHETLLIVSPESLHMNMSIENIVCVHRVY